MTIEPSVTRRDLLSADLGSRRGTVRVEVKEVTLGPRQKAPLHLHPCPVVGIITAGSVAYQVEGEEVRHLAVGDAFYEPANVRVARFDNEGTEPARFAAFYLVEAGTQELILVLAE